MRLYLIAVTLLVVAVRLVEGCCCCDCCCCCAPPPVAAAPTLPPPPDTTTDDDDDDGMRKKRIRPKKPVKGKMLMKDYLKIQAALRGRRSVDPNEALADAERRRADAQADMDEAEIQNRMAKQQNQTAEPKKDCKCECECCGRTSTAPPPPNPQPQSQIAENRTAEPQSQIFRSPTAATTPKPEEENSGLPDPLADSTSTPKPQRAKRAKSRRNYNEDMGDTEDIHHTNYRQLLDSHDVSRGSYETGDSHDRPQKPKVSVIGARNPMRLPGGPFVPAPEHSGSAPIASVGPPATPPQLPVHITPSTQSFGEQPFPQFPNNGNTPQFPSPPNPQFTNNANTEPTPPNPNFQNPNPQFPNPQFQNNGNPQFPEGQQFPQNPEFVNTENMPPFVDFNNYYASNYNREQQFSGGNGYPRPNGPLNGQYPDFPPNRRQFVKKFPEVDGRLADYEDMS